MLGSGLERSWLAFKARPLFATALLGHKTKVPNRGASSGWKFQPQGRCPVTWPWKKKTNQTYLYNFLLRQNYYLSKFAIVFIKKKVFPAQLLTDLNWSLIFFFKQTPINFFGISLVVPCYSSLFLLLLPGKLLARDTFLRARACAECLITGSAALSFTCEDFFFLFSLSAIYFIFTASFFPHI